MSKYFDYSVTQCPICKSTLVNESFTTKKFTNKLIKRTICKCSTTVEVVPIISPDKLATGFNASESLKRKFYKKLYTNQETELVN